MKYGVIASITFINSIDRIFGLKREKSKLGISGDSMFD